MKKVLCIVIGLAMAAEICMTNCFAFKADTFAAKIVELAELRKQCAAQNIDTAYEDINYYTIKKCLKYVEEDTNYYDSAIMEYNETALEELYAEARDNMKEYLAGTKKPKQTHIYDSDGMFVDGKVLRNSESRPIYSIGVGHGAQSLDDLHTLAKFGYSNIHIEASLSAVIKEDATSENGYSIDIEAIGRIKNNFERAESSGLAVNLLISTHYLPDFMYIKYPELEASRDTFRLNCRHEGVKEIVEAFLRALMPAIKDYKALTTIILANEPATLANATPEYYNKYFQEYLIGIYNDNIDELNDVYGAEYTHFSQVTIPTVADGAIAYDWMNCVDILLTEYITFIKDIVSEYTDVPTNVKTMRELELYENAADDNDYKKTIFRGVSHEKLKEISGIAGTDEESYYRHGGGTSMQETMMWYDMLRAIYEKPIYNSEDHLISLGDERYIDAQRVHTTGTLWQSAIHGLYMSSMWIWERSYEIDQFKNQLLSRPDVVAATGKVNYELNRLSDKVSAISEKEPRVALLYSDTARVFESETDRKKTHMAACSKYYLSTLYNGEKVGFITDNAYEHLDKYEVLIIPQVINIPSNVLSKIKAFIENGGRVIIYEYMGLLDYTYDSLKYNEHGLLNDAQTVQYIIANAYKTSVWDDSWDCGATTDELASIFEECFDRRVELVYADTGKAVSGVDWTWTEFEGNILVNMCNYLRNDLSNIQVKLDGNVVESATDLISGDNCGNSFELQEMTPVLLEVKNNNESKATDAKNVTDISYNAVSGKIVWKIAADDIQWCKCVSNV